MILKNITKSPIEQVEGGIFHELKPGEEIHVDIHSAQTWLNANPGKLEKIEDNAPIEKPEIVAEQKLQTFPPVETFSKKRRK